MNRAYASAPTSKLMRPSSSQPSFVDTEEREHSSGEIALRMSAPDPRASAPRTPDPHTAIVARLRAAGCVFAEEEADLLISEARTPKELETMVSRRVDGFPLEHIVGWAMFYDTRIAVDPGVFVPRRRSE